MGGARRAARGAAEVLRAIAAFALIAVVFWVGSALAMAAIALVVFLVYTAAFGLVYVVAGEAGLAQLHSFLGAYRSR